MKLKKQELEIIAAALEFAKRNLDKFKMYPPYMAVEEVTHETLDQLHKKCWEAATQQNAIQELQKIMTDYPICGVVNRKEFDTFCIGGHQIQINNVTAIASHNYKCLGPYAQDQKIELLGMLITVYLDKERSQSTIIHDPNIIESTIQLLKGKCERLCTHELRKELSYETCKQRNIPHSGMHCHVFECFSCKQVFTVDSSG